MRWNSKTVASWWPGARVTIKQIQLVLITSESNTRVPVQILAAPCLTQLPANAPGRAAGDGLSTWSFDMLAQDLSGTPGPWFQPYCALAVVGVKQQTGRFPPSLFLKHQ